MVKTMNYVSEDFMQLDNYIFRYECFGRQIKFNLVGFAFFFDIRPSPVGVFPAFENFVNTTACFIRATYKSEHFL